MDQWNGSSLMWDYTHLYPDIVVVTDASGSWGCGALCGRAWFQHKWLMDLPHLSIAHKELLPIVMASMIWGKYWAGKVVKFVSDNEAVVAVLKSLASKDMGLSQLLKCLVFTAATHNFWFTAQHLPGRSNILADALSRDDLHTFFLQAPWGMSQTPVPFPCELPGLLYGAAPDWLSRDWTLRFKSIMQRV